MKKAILTLIIAQMGFSIAARAEESKPLPDAYLYSICELLGEPQVKLPEGCVATCTKRQGGADNAVYKLTVKKGKQSTSYEISMSERLSRSLIDENTMKIAGGEKGQYPSLELIVDKNENIQSLSFNELECKQAAAK